MCRAGSGAAVGSSRSPVTPRCVPRQECVEQLLRNMFDGEQTENCIVNGTQVLLTLLETRRSG